MKKKHKQTHPMSPYVRKNLTKTLGKYRTCNASLVTISEDENDLYKIYPLIIDFGVCGIVIENHIPENQT